MNTSADILVVHFTLGGLIGPPIALLVIILFLLLVRPRNSP